MNNTRINTTIITAHQRSICVSLLAYIIRYKKGIIYKPFYMAVTSHHIIELWKVSFTLPCENLLGICNNILYIIFHKLRVNFFLNVNIFLLIYVLQGLLFPKIDRLYMVLRNTVNRFLFDFITIFLCP